MIEIDIIHANSSDKVSIIISIAQIYRFLDVLDSTK
jgi:hypothetical protein